MTQRERVLSMLRSAGERGVRSDAFLSARIPRAAARILELKAEGYEVTSEREKQFCRYRLTSPRQPGLGQTASISVDPPEPVPLFEEPHRPLSAFTDAEAA